MSLKWILKEIAFFFIVIPLLLGVIYVLPVDVKNAHFILNKPNYSIESLFLSNYTHSELWHIEPNLIVYLLIMYFIFRFEVDKKTFYRTSAFIFLILPFIISIATLALMPIKQSQGFSGIVAGFIGYFSYVVYNYVKTEWKIKVDLSFLYLIGCINALLALYSYWAYVNPLSVLFVVAIFFYLVYYNRVAIKQLFVLMRQKNKEIKAKPYHGIVDHIIFAGAVIFLFLLTPLIQVSVENGAIANALGHYVGYVGGLAFPILLIETGVLK